MHDHHQLPPGAPQYRALLLETLMGGGVEVAQPPANFPPPAAPQWTQQEEEEQLPLAQAGVSQEEEDLGDLSHHPTTRTGIDVSA